MAQQVGPDNAGGSQVPLTAQQVAQIQAANPYNPPLTWQRIEAWIQANPVPTLAGAAAALLLLVGVGRR